MWFSTLKGSVSQMDEADEDGGGDSASAPELHTMFIDYTMDVIELLRISPILEHEADT